MDDKSPSYDNHKHLEVLASKDWVITLLFGSHKPTVQTQDHRYDIVVVFQKFHDRFICDSFSILVVICQDIMTHLAVNAKGSCDLLVCRIRLHLGGYPPWLFDVKSPGHMLFKFCAGFTEL